ncbi:MAG: hypothetical protein IK137_00545 [Bacilli bacterium]|nr:hypothetical protein [Bacilli bacterium]
MKKDKISISLVISIFVFIIAGIFFWNQSKQAVVKSEIPYNESGSSSYKVYLDANDYYDSEYLAEGMQYISSIIKYIEVSFNYNASYADIKDYEVYRNIYANIVVTDSDDGNKVIYSKKEKVKEEKSTTDELIISDSLNVDYKKYNNIVNTLKTKYGISANSNLIIEYNLVYTSKNGNINNAEKMIVTIPLSKQMINIDKGKPIYGDGLYTIVDNNTLYNVIMAICAILMVVFTGVDLAIVIIRAMNRINKESKYDRFLKKALREYDSYITESKDEGFLPNKPIIRLNSFKELLDVRNNIDKTIIYTRISNDTSKFEIIDEVIYEYVVTREDMENK